MAELRPVRTIGRRGSEQVEQAGQEANSDIDGFDFTFDQSAVGHVIRRHGNPGKEWATGQRAVEAGDFAMLPRIASQPLVPIEAVSELGEPMAEQRLTVGNETFVARWAIRGSKRRTLALKTMFIKVKVRGPRPTS